MTIHLERFENRLRERGLRVTPERRAILEFAFRHFGHFDAEELRAALDHSGIVVSRATVYRTLTHLVETGFLRRHPLGRGRTFYEPSFGRLHHEHLVCVRCGAILEFVQDDIEQLQEQVCREHGFRPLRHTLQIHGVCAACQGHETATPGRRRPAGATNGG